MNQMDLIFAPAAVHTNPSGVLHLHKECDVRGPVFSGVWAVIPSGDSFRREQVSRG